MVFLSSLISLNYYIETVYTNYGQDRECPDVRVGKRYHNIFKAVRVIV